MSAANSPALIHPCIKRCILPGDKIFTCLISGIPQTASDNLFYLSAVNLNTWSEFHPILSSFQKMGIERPC